MWLGSGFIPLKSGLSGLRGVVSEFVLPANLYCSKLELSLAWLGL